MNFLLSDLTVIVPTKNDHYRIEENLQKLLDYFERASEKVLWPSLPFECLRVNTMA